MKHVTRLEDVQLEQPSMITIGVFDGVHRGHQTLIEQLLTDAHDLGWQALVLTFYPHPDVILGDIQDRYYLTTPEHRAELLGNMGVDVVVTHPFNDEIRRISAADFVDKLVKHLNMKSLRVGSDFVMGYEREGNVAYLTELGKERDFDVRPLELFKAEGEFKHISSTAIRELLQAGAVEDAAYLLGRSYCIEGEVIKGDQRGRLIGFPTANMAVWEQQVLPAYGVYTGWVTLGDERFMAVTNVGVRPTFEGDAVTVEPHILDFDRDIYGETLRLTFEKRLRGEQKFDGIDALKAQLNRDIAQGRALLEAMFED
jgi:riboflavin kinase / FMN adenylyltransferase